MKKKIIIKSVFVLFISTAVFASENDCNKFELAKDIDPEYCELLIKAVKKNLKILCYDCKFSSKGIELNRNIEFKI